MRKILNAIIVLSLMGCTSTEVKVVPGIVPNSIKETKVIKTTPNNIIGEIEPIYLLPMKSPFLSRIDTGASISSLDADEIRHFERDGKKWVSFTIINRDTKEEYIFEKPVLRSVQIKRIGQHESRPLVKMEIKMGGEIFKAKFTLAEREKFDYQTLIGRNILNGRAIVDVSLSNTLK